jgi:putative DNA primase/helicase
MEISDDVLSAIMTLEADHEGHAQATAIVFPKRFRHNESHGWLSFNGTHWESEGAEQALNRAITRVMNARRVEFASRDMMGKARMCSVYHHVVKGVMGQMAKMKEVYTPIVLFDKSPDTINVKNGVLNLRTGEVEAHTADSLFTYCLPVPYEADADATPWLKFLTGIGISDEIRDYIQLALGYTLTGHTRDEVLFYVYGKTRSGKGTFVETVREILGRLGEGVDMTSFTASRAVDTQRFDLAPLKGKRFLTASETERGKNGALNASVIKSITGGDEIRCAFKRRDHFSYRPEFKLWLTSNFPVNLDVNDDAAWYRLRVIHFPLTFAENEDKTLKENLKTPEVLRGVLAWMVAGSIRWFNLSKRGLPMPQEVRELVTEQRYQLDTVQQFLDQNCGAGVDMYVSGAELYSAYTDWAEAEGYHPYGRPNFSAAVVQKGFPVQVKKVGGKATRVHTGIGLAASLPIIM